MPPPAGGTPPSTRTQNLGLARQGPVLAAGSEVIAVGSGVADRAHVLDLLAAVDSASATP
ncbi:hypothetical protein [Specibacter cremeus]|uniref:hypothetical protein n=1 Tax=Specibacter cremeus TaxID=1629051 RepID=UPI000F78D5B8|nr:hypothetical protein [Specibacter cremeus]